MLNVLENVVCEMAAILSRGRYVHCWPRPQWIKYTSRPPHGPFPGYFEQNPYGPARGLGLVRTAPFDVSLAVRDPQSFLMYAYGPRTGIYSETCL